MAALEAFWLANGDPWGPAPPIIPATPGNALGILFPKPTFIETATCRCIPGKAPIKACEVHCHLIYARQAVEDELVTLSLV